MYATGNGKAGKELMMTTMVRAFPTVEIRSSDEADALAMLCMCARHLGAPLDGILSAKKMSAMDGVQWAGNE